MNCSICGDPIVDGYGHNPQPIKPSVMARCCDTCNYTRVIPARINVLTARRAA